MNYWLKLILPFTLFCLTLQAESNSLGMELVQIRAGKVLMGTAKSKGLQRSDFPLCNNIALISQEGFQFEAQITKSFQISKTEVTIAQFKEFLKSSGYKTQAEKSKKGILSFSPKPKKAFTKYDVWEYIFTMDKNKSWKDPGFPQGENHPVVGVSWIDAKAFCKWLSEKENKTYRLPTEAEWEYVCKAGSSTHYSFGNSVRNTIHKFANIGNVELEKKYPDMMQRQWLLKVSEEPADPHVYTAPVAAYPANPWGVHDMHGNVWEWCEDYYHQDFYQQNKGKAVKDPINKKKQMSQTELRVVRGGSWYNQPMLARSSARGFCNAKVATAYIGFRVVCELD